MENYIVIYFDLLEGSVTPRRRQAYFVNMAVGNDSKKQKALWEKRQPALSRSRSRLFYTCPENSKKI